jgi:hypothetical protein
MDLLTPAVIVTFIGGLLQPYVQEFILGRRIDGRAAVLVTFFISAFIATAATWLTGGFAGINLPVFTLADPSPLLAYLWPKIASVFALSQLVFQGTDHSRVDPHVIASTPSTP